MKLIFKTDKFFIKTFSLENFDDFTELNQDIEISRYVNHNPNESAKTFRECIEKFQELLELQEKYGYSYWAVYDNKNECIGQCGLAKNWDDTLNFCYMFKKKYWGRGIATEICGLVLDYIFKNFKEINLLKALSFIQNIASVKLLKKFGFKHIRSIEEFGKELQFFELTREDYEKRA